MPNMTPVFVLLLLIPFVCIGVCLFSNFSEARAAKAARDVEMSQVGTYEAYWFPWRTAVAETEGLDPGFEDGSADDTRAARRSMRRSIFGVSRGESREPGLGTWGEPGAANARHSLGPWGHHRTASRAQPALESPWRDLGGGKTAHAEDDDFTLTEIAVEDGPGSSAYTQR